MARQAAGPKIWGVQRLVCKDAPVLVVGQQGAIKLAADINDQIKLIGGPLVQLQMMVNNPKKCALWPSSPIPPAKIPCFWS